jgi:hypothetical protein
VRDPRVRRQPTHPFVASDRLLEPAPAEVKQGQGAAGLHLQLAQAELAGELFRVMRMSQAIIFAALCGFDRSQGGLGVAG